MASVQLLGRYKHVWRVVQQPRDARGEPQRGATGKAGAQGVLQPPHGHTRVR